MLAITLLSLLAMASCEPYIYQFSPYASAALVAPAAAPVVAPAAPVALPYSSVSAYSYGSSYSIQDYLAAVPYATPAAAALTYGVPLPYGELFFRR